MKLELQNVRVIQADGGARLAASVVAVDYQDRTGDPFTCFTSCWADLLNQWGAPLVQKYLIKEAVQSAQHELDKAQAYADGELAQAKAVAATMVQPTAPAPDAPQEEQDAYQQALTAYDEAQAKVAASQAWKTALDGFAALMDAEIPVRVNSFYAALKAFHEGQGDTDRAEHVQAEWDAWQATQIDASGLEGPVSP